MKNWAINILFALAIAYGLLVLPVIAGIAIVVFLFFGLLESLARMARGAH